MKRHPNKDIRAAIAKALDLGWVYVETGKWAHAFCRLRCKLGHSEHQFSVWSTPKNTKAHAFQILRKVRQCQTGT